jgi:hypothetical protein
MTNGTRSGEGSASRPGRFLPPGKTRYPLYRKLDRPQGRFGQVRKISPLRGFDPRTVQPIASRYTDWATRSTLCIYIPFTFRLLQRIWGRNNSRPLKWINIRTKYTQKWRHLQYSHNPASGSIKTFYSSSKSKLYSYCLSLYRRSADRFI